MGLHLRSPVIQALPPARACGLQGPRARPRSSGHCADSHDRRQEVVTACAAALGLVAEAALELAQEGAQVLRQSICSD